MRCCRQRNLNFYFSWLSLESQSEDSLTVNGRMKHPYDDYDDDDDEENGDDDDDDDDNGGRRGGKNPFIASHPHQVIQQNDTFIMVEIPAREPSPSEPETEEENPKQHKKMPMVRRLKEYISKASGCNIIGLVKRTLQRPQ